MTATREGSQLCSFPGPGLAAGTLCKLRLQPPTWRTSPGSPASVELHQVRVGGILLNISYRILRNVSSSRALEKSLGRLWL